MIKNLLLIAVLLLGTSITFAGEAQDKKGTGLRDVKNQYGRHCDSAI